MPTFNEIELKRNEKKFKKREYRPWDIEGATKNNLEEDVVLHVCTDQIKNWEFHDRPQNELGDIETLAEEFSKIGQQLPCIVRPSRQKEYLYELIAGERRWHAAQKCGLKLKIIVKDLSDQEAALVQMSENHNRKSLSDYARGISYSKLIDNGILTQTELTERLKLSKQQISRLLSFSKIPKKITEAIRDMSKISARTAEQIKQLSNKGEEYIEAIINLSKPLREKKIGYEKLKILVEKNINKIEIEEKQEYLGKNNQLIFTKKLDKNLCITFCFSKEISSLFINKTIDIKKVTTTILEILKDPI